MELAAGIVCAETSLCAKVRRGSSSVGRAEKKVRGVIKRDQERDEKRQKDSEGDTANKRSKLGRVD